MVSKKFLITRNQLFKLYAQERLSTAAIAKIFGCNHVTILNYLKKYNLPRRSKLGNRKPITISREVLFDLYQNKKLTQKQIAERFGHSRYGMQRWMKIYGIISRSSSDANRIYPKFDFRNDLIEKSYLIGFRLGDLNIYKVRKLIQARCSSTKQEQVNLFKNLFKNYGHVTIWRAARGTFEMVVLLNMTFDFLLPKQDIIANWIIKNNKYFLAFLAGYADAEGSYYLRKPNIKVGKIGWSVFEIQTYDKNIIWTLYNKLKELKIDSKFLQSRKSGHIDRRGVKTNKDCWRITIHKKQALWNFIKIIEPYHKHKNKLEDLRKVKENLLLRNSLPYCKPIVL